MVISRDEIEDVLSNSRSFRNADLRNADFSKMYISDVDFTGAWLQDANFSGSRIANDTRFLRCAGSQVNFTDAHFCDSLFHRCDMFEACFAYARLQSVSFVCCDMYKANFDQATLFRVYFSGVSMAYASFKYAKFNNASSIQMSDFSGSRGSNDFMNLIRNYPDGKFIGWKQLVGNRIAKLQILGEVSGGSERKLRTSKAKVLAIYENNREVDEGYSHYRDGFLYRKGAIVEPDEFNTDPTYTCTGGIHFFLKRHDAEKFVY